MMCYTRWCMRLLILYIVQSDWENGVTAACNLSAPRRYSYRYNRSRVAVLASRSSPSVFRERRRQRSLLQHRLAGHADTHLYARVDRSEHRTEEVCADTPVHERQAAIPAVNFNEARAVSTPKTNTRTPRIYVRESDRGLYTGQTVELSNDQVHYIFSVMRLRSGSPVRVFDGTSGEFMATVCGVAGVSAAREGKARKRSSGRAGDTHDETKPALRVEHLLRSQPRGAVGEEGEAKTPDVEVIFAPIRKQRMKMLVEKAVELGASCLIPVLTARTQKSCSADARTALVKLSLTAVEAAEQCERMTVPRVETTVVPLESLFQQWYNTADNIAVADHCVRGGGVQEDVTIGADFKSSTSHDFGGLIFVCKERDVDAPPLLDALRVEFAAERERRCQKQPLADPERGSKKSRRFLSPCAFLVGPEGGFAAEEIEGMAKYPFVRFVSLGPTVLRAETAAMYALSCWSAFWAAGLLE